jgi:hypothetical protein
MNSTIRFLIFLSFLFGLVGLLLFLGSLSPEEPPVVETFVENRQDESRRQEIIDRHNLQTEAVRSGIIAGHLAAESGLDLEDYLFKIELEWIDLLAETLEKEKLQDQKEPNRPSP